MLGYMSKGLNQVGKYVLIKAVITVIPTFAMSVFVVPKTWCSKINVIIA